MDNIWILLPFVLGGAWVAWRLFLEHVCDQAALSITEEDFSRLVAELGSVGTVESKSFFLIAKREVTVAGTFCLSLPIQMDVSWLRNATLLVSLNPEPNSDSDLGEVTFNGTATTESDFGLVPIPRVGFRNGGGANQYTPKVWFERNPAMLRVTEELYARNPEGFLYSVFHRTGRLNSPFEWLQSPPRLRCEKCSEKLLPVLQIDGASVGLKTKLEYYIAACPAEPGVFKIFADGS